MRSRAEAVWIVLGAMVGGFITASFELEPTWVWAMLGGAGGGITGAAAAYVAAKPWSLPLRWSLAALVVLVGLFAVWLAAGYQYMSDPSNYRVRSPGAQ